VGGRKGGREGGKVRIFWGARDAVFGDVDYGVVIAGEGVREGRREGEMRRR